MEWCLYDTLRYQILVMMVMLGAQYHDLEVERAGRQSFRFGTLLPLSLQGNIREIA